LPVNIGNYRRIAPNGPNSLFAEQALFSFTLKRLSNFHQQFFSAKNAKKAASLPTLTTTGSEHISGAEPSPNTPKNQ